MLSTIKTAKKQVLAEYYGAPTDLSVFISSVEHVYDTGGPSCFFFMLYDVIRGEIIFMWHFPTHKVKFSPFPRREVLRVSASQPHQ